MAPDVFQPAHSSFSILYLASNAASGFTTPTWLGYPAVPIDDIARPATAWLLSHQLPHAANLSEDPDGDGVSLRMAYALNLNPLLNLQNALPAPVVTATDLNLSFYGASRGITYQVETSTDLTSWTTQGVTLSAVGPDGVRTASVPRDTASRFLRLAVSD